MSHARSELDQHVLSKDEKNHIAELPSNQAQRRFRTGRVLLRRALSSFVNHTIPSGAWRFMRLAGGKLRITNPGIVLEFSLSHTENGAAVAISAAPVGLDIEELARPLDYDDALCFLAPRERRRAEDLVSEQLSRFLLALWTLKEAHLKLRGTGLATDPATVEFELDAAPQTDEAQCLKDGRGARAVVFRGRVAGREVITSLAV